MSLINKTFNKFAKLAHYVHWTAVPLHTAACKGVSKHAYILTIFLILFSLSAISKEENVTFSLYNSNFNNVSVTENGGHVFTGEVTVSGMIFFTFDGESDQKIEVLYAKFVPDIDSIKNLPNVIKGIHSSRITYVSLEPAEKAIDAVFNKEKLKSLNLKIGSELKINASIKFQSFIADVNCDSRTYWSSSFEIIPIFDTLPSANGLSPIGC